MMARPLVALDTNVLVDMWLGRDGGHAVLLLDLAEQAKIDVAVPFATKDKDFDYPELHAELLRHDFMLRSDLGRIYGELR
jgi:predicted nucleic acid-binding protein